MRKYIVTEEVQQTVPVRHEEVRVEREPITDDNRDAAMSGPDIGEAEHEVTLHEERPVIQTETVPVERVRMTTQEHAGEETVHGTVRKEKIDAESADAESADAESADAESADAESADAESADDDRQPDT
ncbi:YsnF/AvaK domain-containing protein [Streptomyces sp. NPDC093094]|uniref:YsnF/AvaK domain-containing protein n=1 Tax=Streptomyces sp. NPDC093094 TaxID=3366026 RepID=UPI0038041464